MKRRGFLQLIGAAVAAPMMPAMGSAAGASRSAYYGLAIAHAKRFPLVSARGMSKHIGVSQAHAEAILRQMSSEGLLGVLNPTRPGSIRASSKIFVNDVWGIKRTSEPRPTKGAKQQQRTQDSSDQPKVSEMFAHLHDLCTRNGLQLSPRCLSGVHT